MQQLLKNFVVVGCTLARHEYKTEWHLFVVFTITHKWIDGKQLFEGMSKQLKSSINIPFLGF